MTEERAVLAGGCFWGVQDLFRRYDGVLSTRVGYTGGSYTQCHLSQSRQTCGSGRDHLRSRPDQLSADPRVLLPDSRSDTRNAQGNDIGTSYRSAIFYTSDEQRLVAEDTIADVDESGLWPGKVVTEVVTAGDFWEAEPEHQDYLLNNPGGYTCHFVRPGWKLPIRKSKATKLA